MEARCVGERRVLFNFRFAAGQLTALRRRRLRPLAASAAPESRPAPTRPPHRGSIQIERRASRCGELRLGLIEHRAISNGVVVQRRAIAVDANSDETMRCNVSDKT